MPPSIFARLVMEANQHSKLAPMGWGADQLGRGMALGNDYWVVGTELNKGRRTYRVTCFGHRYGGGEPYQRIWFVDPESIATKMIPMETI